MTICESTITVRYAETDQMGIVHHSNYYIWFEVGRTDYIKKAGMSYDLMEQEGVLIPLIDSYCKYILPARYGDVLILKTEIEELAFHKVKFKYQVLKKDYNSHKEVLISTGYTCHVFVDKSFKVINLKKKNDEIWKLISEIYCTN